MNLVNKPDDLQLVQQQLPYKPWLIACLCAAWCDTCASYKIQFEQLSLLHPELCFVWIDIEDQAHLVGDLDIENFPTLLIQQEHETRFFGTMLPDTQQLKRLILSLLEAHSGILFNDQKNIDVHKKINIQGVPNNWSLRALLLETIVGHP